MLLIKTDFYRFIGFRLSDKTEKIFRANQTDYISKSGFEKNFLGKEEFHRLWGFRSQNKIRKIFSVTSTDFFNRSGFPEKFWQKEDFLVSIGILTLGRMAQI
jgi:hypothetical protein